MIKLKLWFIAKLYHYHNNNWAKYDTKADHHKKLRQYYFLKYKRLAKELSK